jgi:hypothetical protein
MSGALPKFQFNFYSEPQFVSSNKRIVNKNIAANGIAYSSPSKISHYLKQAKGGDGRDFLQFGDNKTDFLKIPNGGIVKPEDCGVWGGKLYRISYAPKSSSEKEVVLRGVVSGWWMEWEAFNNLVKSAGSPADLLQMCRFQLALGRELSMDTTRFISVPVKKPLAAYLGRAAPTSKDYGSSFPTLYGNPTVKQLFIPGLNDVNNQPDQHVIKDGLHVDGTNSWDAVGVSSRFGRMSNRTEAAGNAFHLGQPPAITLWRTDLPVRNSSPNNLGFGPGWTRTSTAEAKAPAARPLWR